MHPKRSRNGIKSRRFTTGKPSNFLNGLEKKIIKVMALFTIMLFVFQMTVITDPVDFYLRITGDIDSPAFNYDQYADAGSMVSKQTQKTIALSFLARLEGLVIVLQNDKTIGTIEKETKMNVEQGTVVLDARHIPYPVVVDIVLNDQRHQVELNGDMKSFEIQFK